jgi:cell division transport system permease protein
MRTRLFFSEAFRSVGSNFSTTVAATMTVLIGMFLLGLFIALGTWVLSWSNNVERGILVKIFFVEDATPTQINRVNERLVAMPEVKSISFVSKEDALRRMKERYPQLTQDLPSNPLPPAFEVKPTDANYKELIASRVRELALPGVDSVNTAKKESDRVLQVARIIGVIFLAGSIILLVASTLLIANTIRLSIFSRRREVEVMKLVGATNWFVRGPFMLEGLMCGLAGSILAIVLLVLAREFALPVLQGSNGSFSEPGVRAMSFSLMALILVGVSLLVGAVGSGITLRRFLRV